MKIGIICASDEELAPFLPLIKNRKLTNKAMLTFYEGQIHHLNVLALYSGVCKVNAAIASQILIDQFRVDIIINSGVAGGIHPQLELFDIVISTEVCYHDVAFDILTEFHPWMKSIFFEADKQFIQLSKLAANKMKTANKIYWGRMVTGESFITSKQRQKIEKKFAPLTTDMETASIAHVCYVNQLPFISIRCITDNATHSGKNNFEKNCAKASMIAKDFTISLLDEIDMNLLKTKKST